MLSNFVWSFPRCSQFFLTKSINQFQRYSHRFIYTVSETEKAVPELDRLFPKIFLEVRGHDKAVLQSYTKFLQTTCKHLSISCSPVQILPYFRWIIPLLRAKFVYKKYKLHYETRTYIRRMSIAKVTGSTASTFLEYVERNIPEGVAMKVTYEEAVMLPKMIVKSLQNNKLNA